VLAKAAQYKLPAEWVVRLTKADPERRQVLRVRNVVAGSLAAEVLRTGDMILAVNGRPVTCFGDVEAVLASGDVGGREGDAAVRGGDGAGPAEDEGEGFAAAASPSSKRRRTASRTAGVAGAAAAPSSSAKGGKGRKASAVPTAVNGVTLPVSSAPPPPTDDSSSAARDASSEQGRGAEPDLMSLTVFRSSDQEVMELKLRPGVEDGMGTGRIVHFCGAQIQVGGPGRQLVGEPRCLGIGLLDGVFPLVLDGGFLGFNARRLI